MIPRRFIGSPVYRSLSCEQRGAVVEMASRLAWTDRELITKGGEPFTVPRGMALWTEEGLARDLKTTRKVIRTVRDRLIRSGEWHRLKIAGLWVYGPVIVEEWLDAGFHFDGAKERPENGPKKGQRMAKNGPEIPEQNQELDFGERTDGARERPEKGQRKAEEVALYEDNKKAVQDNKKALRRTTGGAAAPRKPCERAYEVADKIRAAILERNPKHGIGGKAGFKRTDQARALERLHLEHAAEPIPWHRIETVALWAVHDDFWGGHITGPSYIKLKWDKLTTAMERPPRKGEVINSTRDAGNPAAWKNEQGFG